MTFCLGPHISPLQQMNYYTPVGGCYNRVKFEFCKWHFHTPSHTIGESLETFKMSFCLRKKTSLLGKTKHSECNNSSAVQVRYGEKAECHTKCNTYMFLSYSMIIRVCLGRKRRNYISLYTE